MNTGNQIILNLPIGSKVQIVPDLEQADNKGSPGYNSDMLLFQNQIVTITECIWDDDDNRELYRIAEDGGYWYWSHHFFFDLPTITNEVQSYEYW